jgi:prepilin-type N-terminal cleavage/methylation domain-containing protein
VNKVKGFTLVEVLITMALLSMIILIGASAFGLFAKRWDGQLGKFDATMQNARNVMLVQEVLDSLVPYMAYDTRGKPKVYLRVTAMALLQCPANLFMELVASRLFGFLCGKRLT